MGINRNNIKIAPQSLLMDSGKEMQQFFYKGFFSRSLSLAVWPCEIIPSLVAWS